MSNVEISKSENKKMKNHPIKKIKVNRDEDTKLPSLSIESLLL
jgi:hypothetical protein